MTSFIHDVLLDLKQKSIDISSLTFILPSKRAGTFLKKELALVFKKTLFVPTIYSIEEFVEELSNLNKLSNIELLFEFYNVYKETTPKNAQDSFDTFSKWAQILLQDFNEIDRYLIPQKNIFEYLSAIQEINHEHWSLDKKQTTIIKNHLAFWRKLNDYYTDFTALLIKKGKGYQGLIYREAVENTESYIQQNQNSHHVFLGFNALNTAETSILQELLQSGNASIYWDIDRVFMEHKEHDAALFIKHHKSSWKYFERASFNWINDHYTKEKHIEVLGIPKNIGQAKYIGELLKDINEKHSLQNTAVVLGNENLLFPILNSIPDTIQNLNITMGFPLRLIPISSLFDQLFLLHKDLETHFYYADVIAILSHQSVSVLFIEEDINYAEQLIHHIQANNLIHVSLEKLISLAPQKEDTLRILFGNWENHPKKALDQCMQLIYAIKTKLDADRGENRLALEYLYKFYTVFNTLVELNDTYKHLSSIKTLYSLYKEVLSTETLDFQGEPLKGLQIMGMLESRVLDFETIIISGVNEGILPSGKSNNSFIPYDVKLENDLPTYKEKDAVYTYHFYRLIQRAKQVYIIYNTEPDVLEGGEKSRFITQLEIEGIHNIKHSIVSPKTPKIKASLKQIEKSQTVLDKIKDVALKGFSPSSLTTYIRNPLDFYYQRILGVKDYDTVEETIAANTLGTVIHNTLEDFYEPFVNVFLTEVHISSMRTKIDTIVTKHFKKEYKEGNISKGKNLIIFEIAKRYVSNFLDFELEGIKQGHQIKIIALEQKNEVQINIPQLNYPITLTGTVDRIDECNGVLRVIDYKTGKVEQNKVEVTDWDAITTDYDKYSKSFQVLMYAYMLHHKKPLEHAIEAGIISFKNLKSGVLKFAKKDTPKSRTKTYEITPDVLAEFEIQLHKLILEICNPELQFTEKEI
jgi:hypothetical protein